MKAFTATILVIIITSITFFAFPTPTIASNAPSVGVKEGDWMEYNVNITGNPSAVHRGLVWMRIEVLQVEDTAFPANVTLRFTNGTVSSSIWQFNFTEGNTEGWLIIPANLSPKDTFYDNYSRTDKNIVVQGEEQKTVLGVSRTITHGNDSYRADKAWDKATGVFVGSTEVFKNWTSTVEITATNLWSPEATQDLSLNNLVPAIGVALAVIAVFSGVIFVKQRGKRTVEKN
jgi:hypothetical protein